MKPLFALTALPAALVFALSTAAAQERPIAGSIGIGTTGISLEAKAKLNSSLIARASYNYLEFDMDDQEYDDIDYDADIEGSTATLAADYHPFQNPWMVSAGLYFGERKVGLVAAPTGNIEVGGQVFTAAQVGTLVGTASVDDISPFIGFGWDNSFFTRSQWSFYFRGGVIFSDSPDVELASVGGTLSNDPLLIAEVEAEEAALEDDIDDFKVYPVLEAGATYRF